MDSRFDIGIIGGGLAGLTSAIQYALVGFKVVLFEKNKYPFHRVCGEYISNESWPFLMSCGLDLTSFNLPQIKKLLLTNTDGTELHSHLDLGGFGISRYVLDNELKNIADSLGVVFFENTKVNDVKFQDNLFSIYTNDETVVVKLAIGSFGKRSNLDIKWQRDFTKQKVNKLNNYVGVKYHIKYNYPDDVIALHNFEKGYCGISKIENETYCLCYLASAETVHRFKDLKAFEQGVLYHNKHLKEIFTNATFVFDKPVVISQVSFDTKTTNQNRLQLLGDACGMIVPLCGNGMSMAMHSSKLFFEASLFYLRNEVSYQELQKKYAIAWNKQFKYRLQKGRWLQRIFQSTLYTNIIFAILKSNNWLLKKIISQTHGKPF